MSASIEYWWLLPGPSLFVEDIADAIREGRNVIIHLPRFAPSGLQEAIRYAFDPEGSFCWKDFDAPFDAMKPAKWLADQLRICLKDDYLDGRTLARADDLPGGVLWINNVSPEHWPVWLDFLQEYSDACRVHPLYSRTVIVVPVVGLHLPAKGVTDVALEEVRWVSRVRPQDIESYVAWRTRDRKLGFIADEIAKTLVAGLAGYDPEFADRLAQASLEELVSPVVLMRKFATDRGWLSCPTDPRARWKEGMAHSLDQESALHSAALAMIDDRNAVDEIQYRIWRAQVAVLLPLVETRRRELIERLGSRLVAPFRTQSGQVVNNVTDLEIGQLEWHLLDQGHRLPPGISVLKEIRNRLAHLKVVPAELIRNSFIGPLPDRV